MNTEQRALWLLRQIMDSLPRKRDWLDPAIEGEARELVKEPAPLTPEPGVMVTVEQPGSMYNGTRGKVLAHSDGYCWVDTVRHGVVGFSPASVLVRDPVPRAQCPGPSSSPRASGCASTMRHGQAGTVPWARSKNALLMPWVVLRTPWPSLTMMKPGLRRGIWNPLINRGSFPIP